MGSSPSEFPEMLSAETSSPTEFVTTPTRLAPPARREPITRYVILFLLTVVTTTGVGALYALGFYAGPSGSPVMSESYPSLFFRGLSYSVPLLIILGAHEFGHYFACRYYGVNASLPYFLPLPLIPFGTLGAVIRIREPIPGKRALFDIGIAGPIAGFLFTLPILFIGVHLSQIVRIPADAGGLEFGEPLLFKLAAWLEFGPMPEGYTVNGHPMVFAALFGMLATALNLFPIGQLDGGHISYATLGRRSTAVTFATVACLVGLTAAVRSWAVWTILITIMLLVFGPRHPRTVDEHVRLDPARLWLAAFAVLMFILCFTVAPIRELDGVLGK